MSTRSPEWVRALRGVATATLALLVGMHTAVGAEEVDLRELAQKIVEIWNLDTTSLERAKLYRERLKCDEKEPPYSVRCAGLIEDLGPATCSVNVPVQRWVRSGGRRRRVTESERRDIPAIEVVVRGENLIKFGHPGWRPITVADLVGPAYRTFVIVEAKEIPKAAGRSPLLQHAGRQDTTAPILVGKGTKDWQKGDRLRWVEHVGVNERGEMYYREQVEKLSDLKREPKAKEQHKDRAARSGPPALLEVDELTDLLRQVGEIRATKVKAAERKKRFERVAGTYGVACAAEILQVEHAYVRDGKRRDGKKTIGNWVWAVEITVRGKSLVRADGAVGESSRKFLITDAAEQRKAMKWKPGDRVGWRETLTVTENGNVELVVVFSGLGDLTRAPAQK